MEHELKYSDEHQLIMDYTQLVGKSCVFYGESGTGKTVLIKSIIEKLHKSFSIIVLLSTTNQQNGTFDGIISPKLIHNITTADAIERICSDIIAEQQRRVKFVNDGNQPEFLKKMLQIAVQNKLMSENAMFQLTQQRNDIKNIETFIKTKIEQDKSMNPDIKAQLINEKQQILTQKQKELTKSIQQELRKVQSRMEPFINATENETIHKFRINTNMLLILDDCASVLQLKEQNKSYFRNLFTQGRHAHITIFITFQSASQLAKSCRNNTMFSFFTTGACFAHYAKDNGFSKQQIELIVQQIKQNNVKLVINQERKHLFIKNTQPLAFSASNPVIHKFLETIENKKK